jgi:hypothetical protein
MISNELTGVWEIDTILCVRYLCVRGLRKTTIKCSRVGGALARIGTGEELNMKQRC